jgi:hypothetical protein
LVSVDVFKEPVGLLMSVALEEWIDGMVLDVGWDGVLVPAQNFIISSKVEINQDTRLSNSSNVLRFGSLL